MATILFTTLPTSMVAIRNGIIRPLQVTTMEHHIQSMHTFRDERIEMYTINIKCIDPRLTDLLARLISGVLFTNGNAIQNAEENILREQGKLDEPKVDVQQDITREPTVPSAVPAGQGDGN